MGKTSLHSSEVSVMISPLFIPLVSRQCFVLKKLGSVSIIHRYHSPDIQLNASFRDEIPRNDLSEESRVRPLSLPLIS
jgi:hypothetical protein